MTPDMPKKRLTRSRKTEATRHQAEATFYRTQAEQAARNWRRRLWLVSGVCFWIGLLLGAWLA